MDRWSERTALAFLERLGPSAEYAKPIVIRLKENAPELDYSSFYGKTGTGLTNCFVMEVERSY
jgi:hypothetical protein